MDGIVTNAENNLSSKITGLLERRPVILQLLRFIAIGVLNTALDFLVFNLITKTFSVESGIKLGQINVIGFMAAVIQSYFWNKYWTFGGNETGISLFKNFVRLVLVGVVAFLAMLLVLLGANAGAPGYYYLIMLVIFVITQGVLWKNFGFFNPANTNPVKANFLTFFVVSLIGLVINSVVIVLATSNMQLTASADLNKNISKILATALSLVWNFIGYKLLVFKR